MSQYKVLAARLYQECKKLQTVVDKASSQAAKANATGDSDYLEAAALSLQNFYMGVERIFEEIAKQVDESLPQGGSSHRDLLEQMALDISRVRPAVIQSQTLSQLHHYRGFRHVVIHRYGFELNLQRVQELVEDLPVCFAAVQSDLERFNDFLSQLG